MLQFLGYWGEEILALAYEVLLLFPLYRLLHLDVWCSLLIVLKRLAFQVCHIMILLTNCHISSLSQPNCGFRGYLLIRLHKYDEYCLIVLAVMCTFTLSHFTWLLSYAFEVQLTSNFMVANQGSSTLMSNQKQDTYERYFFLAI